MQLINFFLVASGLFLVVLLQSALASPPAYMEYDPAALEEYGDYERLRFAPVEQKRACVVRGGNCDHRPNDCCFSTSCRCNLWGANCRCQRKGLFNPLG